MRRLLALVVLVEARHERVDVARVHRRAEAVRDESRHRDRIRRDTGHLTIDLDSLRAVFDLHNTAGMDFPDALREHLRPDGVGGVAAASRARRAVREAVVAAVRTFEAGHMQLDEVTFAEVSDRKVLASFSLRIVGARRARARCGRGT